MTLDPETEALVRQAMRERELSFKAVVNEAIRRGLSRGDDRVAFRTRTRSMGRALLNLDKATQLAAAMEDEEILRKMSMGK